MQAELREELAVVRGGAMDVTRLWQDSQVAVCIKIDEICIKIDEICFKTDGFCIKSDGFCI